MKLLLNVTGDEPCADCGWDEWETTQTNANVIILGWDTEIVMCSDCLQQFYQMKAPGYTGPISSDQQKLYQMKVPGSTDPISSDQMDALSYIVMWGDRKPYPVKKKK